MPKGVGYPMMSQYVGARKRKKRTRRSLPSKGKPAQNVNRAGSDLSPDYAARHLAMLRRG